MEHGIPLAGRGPRHRGAVEAKAAMEMSEMLQRNVASVKPPVLTYGSI
jgi:hypothetical protein